MRFVQGQHVNLLIAMHGVPQVQARAQLQIARFKHPFEQQDRSAPAQGTHLLGLLQVQQGKAIGTAQALEHLLNAVTIGIGLDHGPNLGVGRGQTGACQVVAQSAGVNRGLYRSGHGLSSRAQDGPQGSKQPPLWHCSAVI